MKKKILENLALETMQQEPSMVIRDLFGASFWSVQEEIVEAVKNNRQVAWRSCHGIGKSFAMAHIVLWFLYSFPHSIVLTTAPSYRQVHDVLWKEIRAAYYNSKIPLGGDLPPKDSRFSLDGEEWIALGLTTNDPNRFQGYHALYLMVLVDEGSGVKEDIYEAIQGVLTSEGCYLVVIGNPTDIGGQFHRAFTMEKEDWFTGATSAFDTPNFTEFGIKEDDFENDTWEEKITGPLPMPWLITPQWAYKRFKKWGINHPAYQARVLGQFPTQGERNVIPLSWIERSQEEWQRRAQQAEEDGLPVAKGDVILGVDVARGGMDRSAICIRQGNFIHEIRIFHGLDSDQLGGEVISAYREYHAKLANIEAPGLGYGVIDFVKLNPDINFYAVQPGGSSTVTDDDGNYKFLNLRAELWWAVRENLDPKNPDPLLLPVDEDDELLADLAAPKYEIQASHGGKTQIEDKDKTKARLGRSPDSGDAVMLSFAIKPEEEPMLDIVGSNPVIGGKYEY